jgi:Helix-turn-helix domain of resolvase
LADIMAEEDFQDTALAKALRRRKELQDTIRNAVQEIEKIEEWLKMYRSFSTEDIEINKGEIEQPTATKMVAGHGKTQSIFEMLVLSVLRDVGRPMKSPELIEEFRRRGHPMQGNEIRTAWNRLWEAKSRGVLTSDPKVGYWIAGEPLSAEAREQAIIAGKRRRSGVSAVIESARGKKKGPPELWGPEEIATAERMLLAGKSRLEVAAALGGVSQGTIQKYIPGGIRGLREKYPDVVIPKRSYKSRPSHKRGGRPRTWTVDQERQIIELRAERKTIREIVEATGVGRTSVYKILEEQATKEASGQIRTPEDSN